ncbi:hypothetical protein [Actinokineospora pegani]|uniref:hypothetical protein n=1 Tax=Actinokineospora pegani TaxID=2654637 RepID=UPI0012EA1461|nr:hypothetical protein [Actinokineospora pegani]
METTAVHHLAPTPSTRSTATGFLVGAAPQVALLIANSGGALAAAGWDAGGYFAAHTAVSLTAALVGFGWGRFLPEPTRSAARGAGIAGLVGLVFSLMVVGLVLFVLLALSSQVP